MPLQRGGVRYPGWVHQDHPLALSTGICQHREQQAELTEAGFTGDQFSHGTHRPAFARQTRIQFYMAGRVGALAAAGLTAFP